MRRSAEEHLAKGRATRRQFGRTLSEFQGIQWRFGELMLKLETAQLLLYHAAVNADRGLPSALETTLAKLACNHAGFEVATEAVRIMGGTGFSEESLAEYACGVAGGG